MRALERLAARLLRALDAACTRLYGWRFNPLYQSGTLAFALLLVLIVTGLYLLVFYRVGAPWASVARIDADPLFGRWIRSLHRLASDAMVLAVGVHALRMFAQARSWGPRTLAWVSGVILLLFVFASGWTGFVMVWDTFGAQLAVAGARMFDALPVLSEPVRRVFAGDRPIPEAFFFLNLFLHVAIPLAAAGGLWIHVSRLARPTLLPPRTLGVAILIGLIALSVAVPAPLPPEANPFEVPATVPSDVVYAFWLPWVERLPNWAGWFGAIATFVAAVAIPRLTRRSRVGSWAPSVVDERTCTGCEQCPQDCPWEAIAMQPRADGRDALVAHVNASLCVSCGICAGSCAPMGVGPPLRTGRDQVAAIRHLVRDSANNAYGQIIAMLCANSSASHTDALRRVGATVYPVTCAGNIHTSAIELALRGGAAGVIVFSCPPRDCRGREGPKWLEQRMYHDREAELQSRVDRRRVRLSTVAPGGLPGTLEAYESFARTIDALGLAPRGSIEDFDVACETVAATDTPPDA
jgi:Pyruvate/2-oxoacid:ferredoxin oxidoreductase delta subunit/coenzyme F420-reducing hydrogenase delta subunit